MCHPVTLAGLIPSSEVVQGIPTLKFSVGFRDERDFELPGAKGRNGTFFQVNFYTGINTLTNLKVPPGG